MYRISLINMPFANPRLPSIALTQLASVTKERFGEQVRVRILYLNMDFVHYLGNELYKQMISALEANNSGLGDWLFRQVAFPKEKDNTQQYFQRYFPYTDKVHASIKGAVVAKRAGLLGFMQQLIGKYKLDQEDLIGLTSMFAQNVASFALARLIKDRNPKTVTILGGANAEFPMGPRLAINVAALDFVASGPSLVSFPQFVEHQMKGEVDKCHEIPGIFSRKNAESKINGGPDAIGLELPIEVPVPLDYDSYLQDLEKNFPNRALEPSLTFETSRGCWWGERAHCTFCGLNGATMNYRAMPPEQALNQFHELFSKYCDRCSSFESVDNILPREYLTDVLPKMNTPPGVSIFYEVKADLKPHEMEALKISGIIEIQPGIESLASSTLKLMRKGTTAFQNVSFLKNCIKYGISPAWNLLIGFPGESEEVYAKYLNDIPRLVHLPPPAGAFPVRFDRYSPYFVQAAEYGLNLSIYEFYRFIYPFSEEVLEKISYYFEDKNYNAEYLSNVVTWKTRLTAATTRWSQRWTAADNLLKAELYMKQRGDKTVIHDTRSGGLVEHEVDGMEVAVLEFLDQKAWKVSHIARHFDLADTVVTNILNRLQGLDLLFDEGERYLSLVLVEKEWVDDSQIQGFTTDILQTFGEGFSDVSTPR